MKIRYITTSMLVLIASILLITQYQHYKENPWTRDAQVRASIIQITPRVTGQVITIHVDDNALVQKGDLLFEIDDSVYKANLRQASATVKQAQAYVNKAKNEQQRTLRLEKLTSGAVSVITLNNLAISVETAMANLEAAKANQQTAQLNLGFTKVYAPTNGYITNLKLRIGDQVVLNQPVVA